MLGHLTDSVHFTATNILALVTLVFASASASSPEVDSMALAGGPRGLSGKHVHAHLGNKIHGHVRTSLRKGAAIRSIGSTAESENDSPKNVNDGMGDGMDDFMGNPDDSLNDVIGDQKKIKVKSTKMTRAAKKACQKMWISFRVIDEKKKKENKKAYKTMTKEERNAARKDEKAAFATLNAERIASISKIVGCIKFTKKADITLAKHQNFLKKAVKDAKIAAAAKGERLTKKRLDNVVKRTMKKMIADIDLYKSSSSSSSSSSSGAIEDKVAAAKAKIEAIKNKSSDSSSSNISKSAGSSSSSSSSGAIEDKVAAAKAKIEAIKNKSSDSSSVIRNKSFTKNNIVSFNSKAESIEKKAAEKGTTAGTKTHHLKNIRNDKTGSSIGKGPQW